MRPFSFLYDDIARWRRQHYDPVARRVWFEHCEHARRRTVFVLGVTPDWVTYQIIMEGHPHNASPARVRAETFREFFGRAMDAQADRIKEQING